MIPFEFDDGGRAAAGFKGKTGDCVTRAIAIATGTEYRTVYDQIAKANAEWKARSKSRKAQRFRSTSPRNGSFREVYQPMLEGMGWKWTPTMSIGQGCKVHLRADELPSGPIICSLSGHLSAVVDGVLRDTHDCSRDGTRCVYGYFSPQQTTNSSKSPPNV